MTISVFWPIIAHTSPLDTRKSIKKHHNKCKMNGPTMKLIKLMIILEKINEQLNKYYKTPKYQWLCQLECYTNTNGFHFQL